MIGPTDAVQPWMPRAARDSDACLWHVSVVGGARRRGCAAAGVPGFFDGPSGRDETREDLRVQRLARLPEVLARGAQDRVVTVGLGQQQVEIGVADLGLGLGHLTAPRLARSRS